MEGAGLYGSNNDRLSVSMVEFTVLILTIAEFQVPAR